MKAIMMGIAGGVLALALLARVDSSASADCESCPSGFAAFALLASNLNVDNNSNRYFHDEGQLNWCYEDYEPTAGAVEVVEDETEFVNSVLVAPNFINPTGCSGSFDVSAEGKLDSGHATGTLTIHGFVYQPPYFADYHTFTVHQL